MGLDGIGKATGRSAGNINGSLIQEVAFYKKMPGKSGFFFNFPALGLPPCIRPLYE
jgi:hypothetical protein